MSDELEKKAITADDAGGEEDDVEAHKKAITATDADAEAGDEDDVEAHKYAIGKTAVGKTAIGENDGIDEQTTV